MEQTRTCHYCGEPLQQDATVCPVCGERVVASAPPTEEQTAEPPHPIEKEVVATPETSSEPVEAAAPTPSVQPFHPAAPQSAPQVAVPRAPRFDPNTGQPLAPRFDPYTGQPLQPRFDPNTGQPLFSQQPVAPQTPPSAPHPPFVPPVAPPPTNVSRPTAEYIGDEENSSRKPIWLWVIIGIAIVLLAILLLIYCSNRGNSTAVVEADSTEVVDTNAVDTAAAAEARRQAELEAAQAAEKAEYERTHSDEAIVARAKQIWINAGSGGWSYEGSTSALTSNFCSLVKRCLSVEEEKARVDSQFLWNQSDLLGTYSHNMFSTDMSYNWKGGSVTEKTGDVAYVRITRKGDNSGETSNVTWKMVYERGNWYVDDVCDYYGNGEGARKIIKDHIKELLSE